MRLSASLVASICFILIWSTGWIMAKFAAPYATPLTFLLLRYSGAVIALACIAFMSKMAWPNTPVNWMHAAFTGMLLHAGYLGAVWYAISQGLPSSISALLSAVQPILTLMVAPFLLREKVSLYQWCGVGLATAGLIAVLSPRLFNIDVTTLHHFIIPLIVNLGGMISLTSGTLYQKSIRYNADLPTIAMIQYLAALIITLPFAYYVEPMHVTWNITTVLTLLWSVLGLSVGAILLFLYLLRRNEAVRATQLFFLVPPTSALQAYMFFDETFTPLQIAGITLTVLGVALSNTR
jgi:drug/metabolite transporter (DMT)-like permease